MVKEAFVANDANSYHGFISTFHFATIYFAYLFLPHYSLLQENL